MVQPVPARGDVALSLPASRFNPPSGHPHPHQPAPPPTTTPLLPGRSASHSHPRVGSGQPRRSRGAEGSFCAGGICILAGGEIPGCWSQEAYTRRGSGAATGDGRPDRDVTDLNIEPHLDLDRSPPGSMSCLGSRRHNVSQTTPSDPGAAASDAPLPRPPARHRPTSSPPSSLPSPRSRCSSPTTGSQWDRHLESLLDWGARGRMAEAARRLTVSESWRSSGVMLWRRGMYHLLLILLNLSHLLMCTYIGTAWCFMNRALLQLPQTHTTALPAAGSRTYT